MNRPATQFTGPDLCALSARDVVGLLRKRAVSPAEVLTAAFDRIDAVDPQVNAMPTLCPGRAFDAAKALDGETDHPAWMAGLPLSIKDLTPVKGVRTTWGNMALKDNVPDASDPLVERLERRGGIVIGKTNTPEFGAGGNTFNDVFGRTRNPWNTSRNAGGSSGGAAVSLATGECWLAHGSDLAGSLRTPAAYCGVLGLRPTPGRAGGGPATAGFLTEGIPGPMARDVRDLALFLDAMCGFDPRQPISLEAPAQSFQDALEQPLTPLRLAFSPDQGGFAPVEPEIRSILCAAMDHLAGAGGQIRDACPDLPGLYDTYVTLRGLHYAAVTAKLPAKVQAHFKETLRQNTEFGLALSAQSIFDAQAQRTHLYHQMRLFLDQVDVFAIPVVGLEPGPVEEEFPPQVAGIATLDYVDWLRFSFLATTCALPALSLPVGFTRSGLPVGLQLIGPPRGEAKLLRAALAMEQILDLPSSPIDPISPT